MRCATVLILMGAFFLFAAAASAATVASQDPIHTDPACRDTIRPDLYDRAQLMARNARDRQIVDHAVDSDRLSKTMGSLRECLEKYKNIRVGGVLGVPNLLDIFHGMMDRLARQACRQVDSAYRDIQRTTTRPVSLPGGVGGGSVGLPRDPRQSGDGPVDVEVREVSRPQGVLREAERRASEGIRGIFQ